MFSIETLDYETKLSVLICGLWSLNVLGPIDFKKLDNSNLNSISKNQNLGKFKVELIKVLSERCKNLHSQKNIFILLDSLQDIISANNKNNDSHEVMEVDIIKNYIRRFKFFYLYYFNNSHHQYFTQKDLNTIAISVLFFLLD